MNCDQTNPTKLLETLSINGEMSFVCDGFQKERIYLPAADAGELNVAEYLTRYVENEFPEPKIDESAIYSVPAAFQKDGEKQAALAEKRVYDRLRGIDAHLNQKKISGLWMLILHSASYAGRSFYNKRIGKLIMREHDFVLFVQYQGKRFFVLLEVKSTNDQVITSNDLEKKSDSKEIKNNRRSAQRQLRDHLEILREYTHGELESASVQCHIMWPFLGPYTKDPKQEQVKRWKEDNNLHVFEDTISCQDKFNDWFVNVILQNEGIEEKEFKYYLNRFVILSCGVFVKEINYQMMALLTQGQLELLYNDCYVNISQQVLVVHGAAGTGKTLLVLRKLEQLYQSGRLNENNRALYICYWPGIRCEIESKLEALGIKKYVDTARFYITLTEFLNNKRIAYKHIFMDESEALCLALDGGVIQNTFALIYRSYHDGNCHDKNCPHFELHPDENIAEKLKKHKHFDNKGELWFMVDINQALVFLPRHALQTFKTPGLVLNKVMRSTGHIFNFFKQFYTDPVPNISIGHHILGPPIYWVNLVTGIDKTVANVVVDLCSSKGFQAKDICTIPFIVNEKLTPQSVNKHIDEMFAENTYRPQATSDVEYFLTTNEYNIFLIPWSLRVKGLEFKVVIAAIDGDDFDFRDNEDKKRLYIIISRCTSLLIVIGNESVRNCLDCSNSFCDYPSDLRLLRDT